MDWLYTLSGFIVGFVVGVTGVGGGSLMTPVLVLMFGIAPATAVGTDLLYASLTKMGGSWVHGRRGTVDWKVVKLLAMGSLPAALLSMALLHYLALDEKHLKTLITSVLSVALLLTAAALLFKPYLIKLGRRPDGVMFELHAHHLTGATIFTGAILGVLVTISSVGAGALGVVVLLFLYPRAPMAKIVGTDLLYASLTKMGGSWVHGRRGTVDWKVVKLLAMGSLPAALLSMALLHYLALDEKHLKTLITSVLSIALLLTAAALLF